VGATITALPGGAVVTISANATAAAVAVSITATPAVSFVGRQKGLSLKIDRQAKPFESSGDGLYSASVASGSIKFSIDVTIAANSTDDVNGWFESQIPLSITIGTNPANAYGFTFTFPKAFVKSSKVGNIEDKVMWALAFDETCCLQVGATPAIGAAIINDIDAFLVAA
jgi:hypothetical protein